MGCVNCVHCMGYDPEDGRFGPILDPDGGLIFAGLDDVYLDLSFDVPGRLLDHRPTDPAHPECANRVSRDSNGLLWADPPARFGDLQFTMSHFPGLNITNQTVDNTVGIINYSSPPCYQMFWQFSIIRTLHLSTTVTNFEFYDTIDGVIHTPSKVWMKLDSQDTDWEITSTLMHTTTQNYNIITPLTLGYRLVSYATTALYSVHYQIKGIGISAPGC